MVAHPVSLQQVLPGVSPPPASASGQQPQRPHGHFFITDNAIASYLVAGVLSGSAVRLYQYLKRHANRRAGTEHCDRSYDTIAKELGLSRRMVVYAERELEDQGLIHKAAWQGRHRTNRYTFHTPTTPTPGLQKPWRRKRRRPLGAPVESATDCTFTPASESAMDCTLEVQRVALLKVQHVAPIQDVSFKTSSQNGGEAQRGGEPPGNPPALVGSHSPPPPEQEVSTSQEKTTPASTPVEVPPGWTASTLKGRTRELWQA
jgi:Helix-turn-helix domain